MVGVASGPIALLFCWRPWDFRRVWWSTGPITFGASRFCLVLLLGGDLLPEGRSFDSLGRPSEVAVAFQQLVQQYQTQLWSASANGELATVRRLLQQFQDPNGRDEQGESAIWKASVAGHVDVVAPGQKALEDGKTEEAAATQGEEVAVTKSKSLEDVKDHRPSTADSVLSCLSDSTAGSGSRPGTGDSTTKDEAGEGAGKALSPVKEEKEEEDRPTLAVALRLACLGEEKGGKYITRRCRL
eukprot:g1456.t1